MVIKLIKNENYDKRTLKFSKLLPKEYLVVSKEYELPIEGASKQVQGGKWYLFSLKLHDYQGFDEEEMKLFGPDKEDEVVAHFQSDSADAKTGDIVQGTVLKELLKADVGQKLKITMFKNEQGAARYRVEYVGYDESQSEAQDQTQASDQAVEKTVRDLKSAQQPLEQIVKIVQASYDLTEEQIKEIYEGI
jgi:hypothetical protein